MTTDELHELARSKNFKGLAAAFARADLHWHEEEWRAFIGAIEQAAVREVLERMKVVYQKKSHEAYRTKRRIDFDREIDAELTKLDAQPDRQ